MFTSLPATRKLIDRFRDRFLSFGVFMATFVAAFVGKEFFFVDNRDNPENRILGIDYGCFSWIAILHNLRAYRFSSGKNRCKLTCT